LPERLAATSRAWCGSARRAVSVIHPKAVPSRLRAPGRCGGRRDAPLASLPSRETGSYRRVNSTLCLGAMAGPFRGALRRERRAQACWRSVAWGEPGSAVPKRAKLTCPAAPHPTDETCVGSGQRRHQRGPQRRYGAASLKLHLHGGAARWGRTQRHQGASAQRLAASSERRARLVFAVCVRASCAGSAGAFPLWFPRRALPGERGRRRG